MDTRWQDSWLVCNIDAPLLTSIAGRGVFSAAIESLKIHEKFIISEQKVDCYDRISDIEHTHLSH
jgi:hypothetical protein